MNPFPDTGPIRRGPMTAGMAAATGRATVPAQRATVAAS
jgi:hypothetical protein